MNRTEYMRKYRSTPEGKKRCVFADWKFHGLKGDYDSIYDRYIKTEYCDKCNVFLEGKGGNKKCMDHDHSSGDFRMVCCSRCNMKQFDKSKGKNNTSGHKGIVFNKKKKLYQYRKQINGKTYSKRCKCKITLLSYKFCYLLLINHKNKSMGQ
jgi:hypothetical protein